jgi:hypothetical protein
MQHCITKFEAPRLSASVRVCVACVCVCVCVCERERDRACVFNLKCRHGALKFQDTDTKIQTHTHESYVFIGAPVVLW